jgi:hypothetical protein
MTVDHIGFYVLGAAITSSLLVIWFSTTLAVHICKTLRITDSEIFTWDEWADDLLIKHPFFGELFSCPLCLSFWIAIVVATVITYINSALGYWFIPASAFSWPLFSYLAYRLCLKSD